MTDVLVPVYDRLARGYPAHQTRDDGSCSCGEENTPGEHEYSCRGIAYVPFSLAATTAMANDAHFSAYSKPELRRRLATDDALAEAPAMVLFVVDVDVPDHGALSEAWWEGERFKIEMLGAIHPGAYVYTTAHGYRLVYAIPPDEDGSWPSVDCPGARDVWAASIREWLAYIERDFGIVGDRACSDWTRLYRLPRVVRDGAPTEPLHEIGDPGALGTWDRAFVTLAHAATTWSSPASSELPPASSPFLEHVRSRLRRHGPAISGQGGNKHTRTAWGILINDFALLEEEARAEILLWNETCSPPWDEDELFGSQGPAREGPEGFHGALGRARREYETAQWLAGAQPTLLPPADPAAESDADDPGPMSDAEFRAEMESAIARLRRQVKPQSKLDAQLLLLWKRGTHLSSELELARVIGAVARHAPARATEEQVVASCLGLGNPEQCSLLDLYRMARGQHQADETKKQAKFDEEDPPLDDQEVLDKLEINDKGKPLANSSNINLVLRFAQVMREGEKSALWCDVMTGKIGCDGWFEGEPDGDLATAVRTWLSRTWKIDAKTGDVSDQIGWIARKYGMRNPLRDYLTGIQWDGTRRLGGAESWIDRDGTSHAGDVACPGWLVDYCAAPTTDLDGRDITAYIRDVAAKWMISAVARALDPGCQVDTVLVLEGEQGAGKSSAFRLLGGSWFTGTAINIESKDAYMQVHRAWICELAELASLVRTATEAQKAFISQQDDDFRPPYGREVLSFQRRCVFGGTVNPNGGVVNYLRDDTGNRRWWPARIGDIDRSRLLTDRDQLWAEAVMRFQRGERWWFDRAEQKIADGVTEQRRPDDPWPDILVDWARRSVAGLSGIGNGVRAKDRWTIDEIARGALDIEAKDLPREMHRLVASLKRAGFVKNVQTSGSSRRRTWSHPDISLPPPQAPTVKAPN